MSKDKILKILCENDDIETIMKYCNAFMLMNKTEYTNFLNICEKENVEYVLSFIRSYFKNISLEIFYKDKHKYLGSPIENMFYEDSYLIEILLNKGFNLNRIYQSYLSPCPCTPLHSAFYSSYEVFNNSFSENPDFKFIEMFLNYGAEINGRDENKNTILDIIYENINLYNLWKDFFLFLGAKTSFELEKDLILLKKDKNEYENLIFYCLTSNLDKIKELLDTKDITIDSNEYIITPILASLDSKNYDLIDFILQKIPKSNLLSLNLMKNQVYRFNIGLDKKLDDSLIQLLLKNNFDCQSSNHYKKTLMDELSDMKHYPAEAFLKKKGFKYYREIES